MSKTRNKVQNGALRQYVPTVKALVLPALVEVVIHDLAKAGGCHYFFEARGSVDYVAEVMGISRANAHDLLKQSRAPRSSMQQNNVRVVI